MRPEEITAEAVAAAVKRFNGALNPNVYLNIEGSIVGCALGFTALGASPERPRVDESGLDFIERVLGLSEDQCQAFSHGFFGPIPHADMEQYVNENFDTEEERAWAHQGLKVRGDLEAMGLITTPTPRFAEP